MASYGYNTVQFLKLYLQQYMSLQMKTIPSSLLSYNLQLHDRVASGEACTHTHTRTHRPLKRHLETLAGRSAITPGCLVIPILCVRT